MTDLSTLQTYKPVENSRRSEMLAWVFALSIILIIVVSPVTGFFRIGGIFLGFFFLLSAVIISIANWVNRTTKLRINEKEILLFNRIRETGVLWEDVTRLEVFTGRFNDKISIITKSGRLSFDIVNAVNTGMQFGFEQGDEILQTILNRTTLNKQKHVDQGYYYYSIE